MVSPKAGRDVSERPLGNANGAGGQRRPAEEDPDPLEDLDLEDGPLLSRERHAFEVSGFQGASDSAGYAAASEGASGNASILGGAFTPAERRRRCCAAMVSIVAAVLLVAVFLVGGFSLYEWRDEARHTYADVFDAGLGDISGLIDAPAPKVSQPTAQPTPEPTLAPTPEPTLEPTPQPTPQPMPEPTAAPTASADATAPGASATAAAAGGTAAAAAAAAAGPQGSQGPGASPEALAPQAAPAGQPQPAADAGDTSGADEDGSGDPSQPYHRWIYKQPHTWTEADYDASRAAPGELVYTHMAMLTLLPNGSLASMMQVMLRIGDMASTTPGEGNAQQALYWQVSVDGGLTWTAPRAPLTPVHAPSGQQLPMWAPVLHTQGDKVHLFFSVSVEECAFEQPTRYGTQRWTPGGDIMAVESGDNGATWSEAQVVYSFAAEGGIPKMIANKLAVDTDGTWLLPIWRENDPQDAGPLCNLQRGLMGVPAVLRSRDEGANWEVSESVSHGGALPYNWMIEASVAAATPGKQMTEPGQFLQVFRTEAGIPMYASRSADGGASWSVAQPTQLPNPNTKVHMVTLQSGALLLAFDDDQQLRQPLAFAMSKDGGESWVRVAVVERDECGQFSYPTLQYEPEGGRVFVAYTVLFLPSAMPTNCREKYGKTSSSTTEGLPASGVRMYATTEALLEAGFQAALGRR